MNSWCGKGWREREKGGGEMERERERKRRKMREMIELVAYILHTQGTLYLHWDDSREVSE